jgi:hypothetical protein
MKLTSRQVQHLCGVEPATSELVLGALVDERFLCVQPDGSYARPASRIEFLSR